MKTTQFHDIEFQYSRELVPLLHRNALMLCLCSQHDRRLLSLAGTAEQIDVELCTLPRPALLAFSGNTAAVSLDSQIQLFRRDALPRCDRPRERAWWWLFPDRSRFLGPLRPADMHITQSDVWLQSEADGSVMQLPLTESIRPAWNPQDCPHLNGAQWQGCGMTLDGALPAYAAVSRLRSQTPGSQLIDLRSNRPLQITARQFHSPRLHMHELWLLDADKPGLFSVNRQTGATAVHHPLTSQPTAVTFHGTFALVASSSTTDPQNTLPVITVLDLRTGLVCGRLQFLRGLSQIDSLALIPEISSIAVNSGSAQTAPA